MTEPFDQDDDPDQLDTGPSKSQRKREMHALRDLGERIRDLPRSQRDALPLSDPMRRAMDEFDRIHSREARRRHLSFVGKLMRSEDLDAIGKAMDRFDAATAVAGRELHQLESWRNALIESDAALSDFLDAHPGTDRPRLRNAVRNARRERERGEERRHFRGLFQLLREETQQASEPDAPDAAVDASDPPDRD
ncbi:MAG: ribosome biogenesis factor YjgA [Gammaproteobacteria bacterium]|nr:ribosome biogenesis factor YjgA [Gammaproteobacteria bacterium]